MLTGGSTGGWIALAHQVFYPDFYGGTFALCPDGVDFRYHQIVNVYDDANAYWVDRGWTKLERPDTRRPDGNITADDEGRELVRARAGRPLALGRPVGHLGSDLLPGRRRRLSEAHLGQEDGRHRQERRGVLEGALRPAQHPRDQLDDARAEGRQQDQRLRRRRGHLLPEHGRPHARRFSEEGRQPEVDRRDRLSADGAALLGPARLGALRQDRRADRQVRAGGRGPQELEVLRGR